jgi:hypothetical protein
MKTVIIPSSRHHLPVESIVDSSKLNRFFSRADGTTEHVWLSNEPVTLARAVEFYWRSAGGEDSYVVPAGASIRLLSPGNASMHSRIEARWEDKVDDAS